jgi:hypothetical protein
MVRQDLDDDHAMNLVAVSTVQDTGRGVGCFRVWA